MGYADTFRRAFLSSCDECRGRVPRGAWERIWKFGWNRFMMWNPEPDLEKPVLRLTAEKMGLVYWDREPFRFDGAFLGGSYRLVGNYPSPIIAVFEHENDIRGYEQEITKLAQIRCPLKVGITYSNLWQPSTTERARRECEGTIRKWASTTLQELNQYAKEDPESEYVYLLGVDEEPYLLVWYHLSFKAGLAADAFSEQPLPFEALKPEN